MDYRFTDLEREPGLFPELDDKISALWPAFMLEDPVAHLYFMPMVRELAPWQLVLLGGDGEILGGANAVPLRLGPAAEIAGLLPEEGWDWAIKAGVEQHRAGLEPDSLCGLQIAVMREWQGKGLSHLIMAELRKRAAEAGLARLVVPVRPTWKARYPLIPMADYIGWKTSEGLPVDPWLRVHARAGARILKPCERAMRIEGRVADWEAWTGASFPGTGLHVVAGALAPVAIDREADLGVYVEPNVWVEHGL